MEYGNIVEHDSGSGLGRILTTEGRSLFFQQFGAFKLGQLVRFSLGHCAVNVRAASGESSVAVIDVPSDAAAAAKNRFNPAYNNMHGDREAIEAQQPDAAPVIDAGTFSEDLSKSSDRLNWGKD